MVVLSNNLYISLTIQLNWTAVTTFELRIDEEVHNDNNLYKLYERSMGRMVHSTKGLHVVRIVRGTNSQWYEKSRHQSDHITITWNGHCACAMSRDLSPGENDPHFWNPWPQFPYSLCHFQWATTKIKPCYMRKIAFIPLCRLQSSLCMRSITWSVHRGSSKSTRNNFLTSTYLFTIQLLWGYNDD